MIATGVWTWRSREAGAGISELGLAGFSAIRAMTSRNDRPRRQAARSTPFGWLRPSGRGDPHSGEPGARPGARGDILAESPLRCLGRRLQPGRADPEGRGAALAMERALRDADLAPRHRLHQCPRDLDAGGRRGRNDAIKRVFASTPSGADSVPQVDDRPRPRRVRRLEAVACIKRSTTRSSIRPSTTSARPGLRPRYVPIGRGRRRCAPSSPTASASAARTPALSPALWRMRARAERVPGIGSRDSRLPGTLSARSAAIEGCFVCGRLTDRPPHLVLQRREMVRSDSWRTSGTRLSGPRPRSIPTRCWTSDRRAAYLVDSWVMTGRMKVRYRQMARSGASSAGPGSCATVAGHGAGRRGATGSGRFWRREGLSCAFRPPARGMERRIFDLCTNRRGTPARSASDLRRLSPAL